MVLLRMHEANIKLGEQTLARSEVLYKYLRADAEPLEALGTATLLLLRLYYGCTKQDGLAAFGELVKQGLIHFDDQGLFSQ